MLNHIFHAMFSDTVYEFFFFLLRVYVKENKIYAQLICLFLFLYPVETWTHVLALPPFYSPVPVYVPLLFSCCFLPLSTYICSYRLSKSDFSFPFLSFMLFYFSLFLNPHLLTNCALLLLSILVLSLS